MRRRFVTPEGVDLRLELSTAAQRAAAFSIDFAVNIAALIGLTLLAFGALPDGPGGEAVIIIWLLVAFVLRNAYFILFEMRSRGATPGKRALGLRVVARDGGQLTGNAIVARNAMREIEIYLPLSFIFGRMADGTAGWAMALLGLGWSGLFLFMPLLNRDRLRVGDLLAGTWVVRADRTALGLDLMEEGTARYMFSDAQLDVYGIYELQTLEEVIREANEAAVATVAGTIRRKLELRDERADLEFLRAYYAALRQRLERQLLLGRRKANKRDHARRRG